MLYLGTLEFIFLPTSACLAQPEYRFPLFFHQFNSRLLAAISFLQALDPGDKQDF